MPKSAMKREHAAVPKGGSRPRSMFDIGRTHKTTFHGGWLVPLWWDYFFPGEVLKGSINAFVRMSSPLDFPLMDNMKLTCHWYAAPIRILWDNARKFFGERVNPTDSIDYTIPTMSGAAVDTSLDDIGNILAQYLEVPIQTAAEGGVDMTDASALPFRCYSSIWNWHYRDQNLQDSAYSPTDDGPDTFTGTNNNLQFRGKRHDYFTSLLPSPQKGDSVTIGGEVATAANVGTLVGIYSDGAGGYRQLEEQAGSELTVKNSATNAETNVMYPNTTINELRNAVALQRFLETDNRYGTRFDEQIFAHYGVEFNDVRVAPVFLGGGSGYINTSAIPNQSGTTGQVGDLAAVATGSLEGAGFTYAFDEPCIAMCIINVSADLSYQQGLPRKHSKRTRYDMLYPEFVGIGDQAVLNQEIYYGNDSNDTAVLGYSPRYEEFRTGINIVTHEFNSRYPTDIDEWHLAEEFGSLPALNDTFIKDSTPYARVLQTSTVRHFIGDFKLNLSCARQLPAYGVPGLRRM